MKNYKNKIIHYNKNHKLIKKIHKIIIIFKDNAIEMIK